MSEIRGGIREIPQEPVDVAAWREAMKGVTPGPWGVDGLRVFFRRVTSVIARCRFSDSYVPLYEATAYKNAAWIARCSPSGISALLDEIERLKGSGNQLADATPKSNHRGQ